MSKRPVEILIEDIREAIGKIERYTINFTHDLFIDDEKTIDAVVRNFEIIGEAANRLPDELKKRNPDIEWVKIVGLRNRIVHGYFGIDREIIWQILKNDIPVFKSALKQIRTK